MTIKGLGLLSMKHILRRIFRDSAEEHLRSLNKQLSRAIQDDDIVSARAALEQGADPNALLEAPRDRALHLAIDYASDEMIGMLLDLGADVRLARHDYRCHTVTISDYAEIAGRPALAAKLREHETSSRGAACRSRPEPVS